MSEDDLKIHEAHERAEIAHADKTMAPVSLTMAILAVLVAAISLMGHRAHAEVLLTQTRANFQQAKIVGTETQQHADAAMIEVMELIGLLGAQNTPQATTIKERFSREMDRYSSDLDQVRADMQKLETQSDRARRKANRLDVAELLCQMALVLSSITLLTRRRSFWVASIGGGILGLLVLASAFLIG